MDRADKTGRFTREDVIWAKNWNYCAVGELFGREAPIEDGFLAIKGIKFHACVRRGAHGRFRLSRWAGRVGARNIWNELKAYKG